MIRAPTHDIKLDYAEISFYESYVICKIKDNVTVDTEKVIALHEVYRDYYGANKYGYIFDRTTDYTINIIAYLHCPFYDDVTSFAMVSPNEETKKLIKYEDKFLVLH